MRAELRQLLTITPSNRLWQMPFAAALASGLPLLVGAYFGHLEYGLMSSLGGPVFLFLPETLLYHRMVTVMACTFAMTACYTMGVISHFFPLLMMPVLVFIAILVTMLCRIYALWMPGSLFFIMAASIGAYSPLDVPPVPLAVGLISMESLLACLIAFFYSIHTLRLRVPQPVSPLRAVWNKQAHRVLGTGVGPRVSWGLLDTILGCLVGLLGGVCLRSPRFRGIVGRQIRRLIPSRFAQ